MLYLNSFNIKLIRNKPKTIEIMNCLVKNK